MPEGLSFLEEERYNESVATCKRKFKQMRDHLDDVDFWEDDDLRRKAFAKARQYIKMAEMMFEAGL